MLMPLFCNSTAPAALAILTTSQAAGLYIVAGLSGNAVQLLANLVQRDSGGPPSFAVGASGAINGFLAFVGMAFPKSTILLFAIVPVPAWVAVSGLVCYDMYIALRHPVRVSSARNAIMPN
jgi:membrane associated rhomboid family serine protease